MVVAFALSACNTTDKPIIDPNATEECIIKIAFDGLSTIEPESGDLLGVQVYKLKDGEAIPHANGVFGDWSNLTFKGYTNTEYKVVATMVADAQNRLAVDSEIYGKPFEAPISSELECKAGELVSLSKSTATLADGTLSAIPNLDRYYGEASKHVTASDLTITTTLKRVSFGVKATGEIAEGESITIKIAGAPEVELLKDEVEIFTHQYITEAYQIEAYSENINTEVLRNGASIYSDNILYKCGKVATLTLGKSGMSIGFDKDTPFEEVTEEDKDDEGNKPTEDSSPYITKVFEYVPAPGQFVNDMPKYEDGDTQEIMNAKVLEAIGNDNRGMITLGSYGGYVVVGFDHTIQNVDGKLDFRVLGNAFYSASDSTDEMMGGSCEPGIIMVSADTNNNGKPDDEWYEIQGSAHIDHTQEAFYQHSADAGNDVEFYFGDFELTYTIPDEEPALGPGYNTYIAWNDNKGNSDYVKKNTFHKQPYYPQWISSKTMTFSGSRLPQNGVDESGTGANYVLYKFRYGYADNAPSDEDKAAIDIAWAVDAKGERANLKGVDFIKIYSGTIQMNGSIGEFSTEVCGVTDLHINKESLDTFITE